MSSAPNTGFNPFAPGLDFLQSLSKSAQASAGAAMPSMTSWATPTLEPAELDKRITDLKTVHYWLDQNAKALHATIQALEVQKLTLSTLKSMNVNLGDLAKAFQTPTPAPTPSAAAAEPSAPAAPAEAAAQAPQAEAPAAKPGKAKPKAAGTAAAVVDPMQLWTSLTQQFQTLAAGTMREATKPATPAKAQDQTAAAAAPAAPKTRSTKRPAQKAGAKSAGKRKPAA